MTILLLDSRIAAVPVHDLREPLVSLAHVTVVGADGVELDIGAPIDATPEQSDGACYLGAAHLVGGDRYVALLTRAPYKFSRVLDTAPAPTAAPVVVVAMVAV